MGRSIITLPRLGETMEEARVTDWLVTPGTAFRRGDVLLEVETDKTVVEVPALADGTLIAQLVQPGETVGLDQPIAEVEGAEAAAPVAIGAFGQTALGTPPTAKPAPAAPQPVPLQPVPARSESDRPAASPAARHLARVAGIDLGTITGTGRRGRITGADVAGSGTMSATIILVHGLFDQPKGWRDLPARLARTGQAVLTPDLPGHGQAAPVDTLAEAVTALLRLVPQGPIVLVGHSLGAILVTRMAKALGPRVKALILLAPAGLGPRLNADFIDGMLHAETPAALARALALLGGGPLSDLALDAEVARLRAARPAMARLAALTVAGGIQQTDIAADLAALSCPITAVFGLEDRILDWRCCAALPARASIHLVAGAGHLPHLAAPDLVAGLIARPELAAKEG